MWRTLRPSAGQAQQWVSEWVWTSHTCGNGKISPEGGLGLRSPHKNVGFFYISRDTWATMLKFCVMVHVCHSSVWVKKFQSIEGTWSAGYELSKVRNVPTIAGIALTLISPTILLSATWSYKRCIGIHAITIQYSTMENIISQGYIMLHYVSPGDCLSVCYY